MSEQMLGRLIKEYSNNLSLIVTALELAYVGDDDATVDRCIRALRALSRRMSE